MKAFFNIVRKLIFELGTHLIGEKRATSGRRKFIKTISITTGDTDVLKYPYIIITRKFTTIRWIIIITLSDVDQSKCGFENFSRRHHALLF